MNYRDYTLGDWIGHISGVIADEGELDGNEMRDLLDFLTKLPKWIPVSERLPEEDGAYLVTTKWKGSYSGDVYIETNMAVYREKQKEWDCVDIIAWMPLPEPYKESEE